jgi:hypothetical protein
LKIVSQLSNNKFEIYLRLFSNFVDKSKRIKGQALILLSEFNNNFVKPFKNKLFDVLEYNKIYFFMIIEVNETIQIKYHSYNLYSFDIIFESQNIYKIYIILKV